MASGDERESLSEGVGLPMDSLSDCADTHLQAKPLPALHGLPVATLQRPTHAHAPEGAADGPSCSDGSTGTICRPIEGFTGRGSTAETSPEEQQEARHLPEGVVRSIAAYLVALDSTTAFLSLLAFAGTCSQWRNACSELPPSTALSFDSFDSYYSSRPLVQRFRKLSLAAKSSVFEAACKLFTGYSEVSFAGDATTDLALQRCAERVGSKLVKLKVQGTSVATDAGLRAILRAAPALQHVHIEDVSRIASGSCVVDLLERCTGLQTLHLSGMPALQWAPVYLEMSKQGGPLSTPRGLTRLHVRGVNLDLEFAEVLRQMPLLQDLEIDGPARNVTAASVHCPRLQRVSYMVTSRAAVDEAVAALASLSGLQTLELIIKNCTLCSDQLRQIGALPVSELRLDSYVYKQQPTLSRSSFSHVDNEGVKALVDAICARWGGQTAEMQPLKLSLCGATALTHDAVSALLRLPILTELDIGGCCRIIAMDKMRLVAKVRAGREMLESGRRPSSRSTRFPGLFL